ncbi:hypothetical protein DITRI_Ditri05aG0076700 [Diplodiscus trichospermus]
MYVQTEPKKTYQPIYKNAQISYLSLEFQTSPNQWERRGEGAMAFSKKPQEEENKKKSNGTPTKATKKAIKKAEKKESTTKKPNKSKPKTGPKLDKNKNKDSNRTLVESEVIAHPSYKRKQREKIEENEEEEVAKMCRFPMNRIKRIIKSEDFRMALSQDVVFLVNKATEKFLKQFCEDGYKCSVKDHKKSLSYKHLSTVVHERSRYDFLSDYVPEKIKAEDALKERDLTEMGRIGHWNTCKQRDDDPSLTCFK